MWNKRSDEIEELKKIFFEFLKNSCEKRESGVAYRPTEYERHEEEEEFTV